MTRDLAQTHGSAIGGDRPDERAVLVGAHVVGIALARYVVLVEPLASMSAGRGRRPLAPTFQQYLAPPAP